MILHLTAKEKVRLVLALRVLSEEYTALINSSTSNSLRSGFEDDKQEITALQSRVEALIELATDEDLDAQIHRFLSVGKKIKAIKFVRSNRLLGLKEAKDYVDKLEGIR